MEVKKRFLGQEIKSEVNVVLNLESITHKKIERHLSTGQTIMLSTPEIKCLETVFKYIAGIEHRKELTKILSAIKEELLHQQTELMRFTTVHNEMARIHAPDSEENIGMQINEKEEQENEHKCNDVTNSIWQINREIARKNEEIKLHEARTHNITWHDIEFVLKEFGAPMKKKEIMQMIWEIDENNDDVIDFDEFCLTYYRNTNLSRSDEAHSFFFLMDFLIYDQQHKGYIVEDDCMEVLYTRHGYSNLENEMQLLFGQNGKHSGGKGTLTMKEYFEFSTERFGKRALLF